MNSNFRLELTITDEIAETAKTESAKTGKPTSKVIESWIKLGHKTWKKKAQPRKLFRPLDLGEAKVDITKRKKWVKL